MEFYGPEIHESMYFLFFTWGYSLLNPSIPMLVELPEGEKRGSNKVIKPRYVSFFFGDLHGGIGFLVSSETLPIFWGIKVDAKNVKSMAIMRDFTPKKKKKHRALLGLEIE